MRSSLSRRARLVAFTRGAGSSERVVLLLWIALVAAATVAALARPSIATGPASVVIVVFGAATGLFCRRWIGAVLALLLVVPFEIAQGYVNPFVIVLVVAPFVIALMFREHRLLAARLKTRAQELTTEREVFARESVRYERTRIARELHDVVGHCLSVVVLQATAGERLAVRSPNLATHALEDIGRTAEQAQAEVARLVNLLTPMPPEEAEALPRLVGALVGTADAAGLDVTCRVAGTFDAVPEQISRVAYRIVQEALTNSLRHAAGAAVQVTVAGAPDRLDVDVSNGPSGSAGLGLGTGGQGIVGMRERVERVGGQLTAGPIAGGGWHVRARLPLPVRH
jgi:signal transduction histidine kinase